MSTRRNREGRPPRPACPPETAVADPADSGPAATGVEAADAGPGARDGSRSPTGSAATAGKLRPPSKALSSQRPMVHGRSQLAGGHNPGGLDDCWPIRELHRASRRSPASTRQSTRSGQRGSPHSRRCLPSSPRTRGWSAGQKRAIESTERCRDSWCASTRRPRLRGTAAARAIEASRKDDAPGFRTARRWRRLRSHVLRRTEAHTAGTAPAPPESRRTSARRGHVPWPSGKTPATIAARELNRRKSARRTTDRSGTAPESPPADR